MSTRACDFPRVVFEAMPIHRLARRDIENATDEARYCDAGEMPEGVLCQTTDATDVTNDAYVTIKDLLLQVETLRMVASGEILQSAGGTPVFSDNDGKVTATNTGCRVGRLRDRADNVAGADGDIVEVVPDPAWVAWVNTAASAEVENTTVETAFDKSFTLPANTLRAGDVIHIRAHANVVDNNSTDTLTLKLKVGGVEIVATSAVNVEDGDIGILEAWVVVRSIGATGKIFTTGQQVLDAPGTALAAHEDAEATLDTTADAAVTVTATWSVAHADNEVRLDALIVHKLAA